MFLTNVAYTMWGCFNCCYLSNLSVLFLLAYIDIFSDSNGRLEKRMKKFTKPREDKRFNEKPNKAT